jgi:hypothetical protein
MLLHRGLALLFVSVVVASLVPGVGVASTDDVGSIIERFVTSQFPDALSHFWVINSTQWDGDEMIVDVNAVVLEQRLKSPVASRFLLLIVAGHLEAAQSVPLDGGADCRAEEA